MKPRDVVWIAAALAAAVIGSYLLAMAGEPQSYWLWHDVLGLLR